MAKEIEAVKDEGNGAIEPVSGENHPQRMMELAIQKGAGVEALDKIMEMGFKWEANEARKAYAVSFSDVQKRIDGIIKTKVNPQTHSKYEDLTDIIDMVKPLYTDNGLSLIFYEGETAKEDHIRLCVDVLHIQGHKETYHYDVPLDGVGIKGNVNMTKIHGKASSTTYGRRYLMRMIWNIPTKDDDGNAGDEPDTITEDQGEVLKCKLAEVGGDEAEFFQYLGVQSFDEITPKKFKQGLIGIEHKRQENEKKGSE